MSNAETTKQIYKLFKARDVAGILSKIADNAEWQYGDDATGVPWQRRLRGIAEIPRYFAALELVELRKLETKAFVEASDSMVLVVLDAEMVVKANGNVIVEEDGIHIWHYDASGKVIRFRNRCDTYNHMLAYNG